MSSPGLSFGDMLGAIIRGLGNNPNDSLFGALGGALNSADQARAYPQLLNAINPASPQQVNITPSITGGSFGGATPGVKFGSGAQQPQAPNPLGLDASAMPLLRSLPPQLGMPLLMQTAEANMPTPQTRYVQSETMKNNLGAYGDVGMMNVFRARQGLPPISASDFKNGIPNADNSVPNAGPQTPALAGAAPQPQGAPDFVKQAFLQQESGNNPNAPTSPTGAVGPAQIEPETFKKYAQPGESIANPTDNVAVGGRILDSYWQQYRGDPARMAVAYYSGEGNVAPANSPTPWKRDLAPKTGGPPVSMYVAQVTGKMQALAAQQPQGAQAPPQPDMATIAGAFSPTMGMQFAEHQIVPMAPDEQKAFIAQNPGANPYSTWGRNFYGQPVEIVKSDMKSPGAQAQTVETSKAEAQARNQAAIDAINAVAPGFIDQQAQAIASYRVQPQQVLNRNPAVGAAVMAKVYQLNPSYDARQFAGANKTVMAFDTGKQGDTVRSMNVAVQHLGTLQQVAGALQNGDVKALNMISNTFQDQFGSPVPNNFAAVRNIVADEVTKAVLGGAGALGDRDEIRKTISAANSPAQLAGVIQNYKNLLTGQLNGLRQQFVSGTKLPPTAFDEKLLPETRAALANMHASNAQPSGQTMKIGRFQVQVH